MTAINNRTPLDVLKDAYAELGALRQSVTPPSEDDSLTPVITAIGCYLDAHKVALKYYGGTLVERNGDRSYSHYVVFATCQDPKKYLHAATATYLGQGIAEGNGHYFEGGQYYLEAGAVKEITLELFKTLLEAQVVSAV